MVRIKTTVYPGINSDHIIEIAKKAAGLCVNEMKLFPFLANGDDCPRPVDEAGPAELEYLAGQAAKYLPTRFIDLASCREMTDLDFTDPVVSRAIVPKPSAKRPNLAVCSSDGFEVDLHLGQAGQYLIYGPKDGPVVLLEVRPASAPGGWRHPVAKSRLDLERLLCRFSRGGRGCPQTHPCRKGPCGADPGGQHRGSDGCAL